jgi:hypothetical protein
MNSNEEKLRQEIEGKSVILVGPAPIMKGRCLGKWIDTFDFVLRTNGAINLLDRISYQKDYGKKCDMLCINVQFHRESKPLPLERWKKRYGLKFLGMKTNPVSVIQNYSKTIPTLSLQSSIGKLHKTVKGVLYGPVVMDYILQYKPKELWFTGIDFYFNKPDIFVPDDWREYFPNYLPEKVQNWANVKNIGKVDPHDQYSNCKFMWELLQQGRIKTNNFIYDIMGTIISDPEYYSYEGRLKRTGKKK